MTEWVKDFYPLCLAVITYVIVLERRLARVEGKLRVICNIFCELVQSPNPDKKGSGKSWRYLFGRAVRKSNDKKKGGDNQ